MTSTSLTLERRIRGAMAERGILQADVARALGVTQQCISMKLNGKVAISKGDLHRIAELLEVNEDRLKGTSE